MPRDYGVDMYADPLAATLQDGDGLEDDEDLGPYVARTMVPGAPSDFGSRDLEDGDDDGGAPPQGPGPRSDAGEAAARGRPTFVQQCLGLAAEQILEPGPCKVAPLPASFAGKGVSMVVVFKRDGSKVVMR